MAVCPSTFSQKGLAVMRFSDHPSTDDRYSSETYPLHDVRTATLPGRVVAVGIALYLAACRLLESPNRYTSPAYASAKAAMHWTGSPIRAWGMVFAFIGVGVLVGWQTENAWLLRGTCAFAVVVFVLWGSLSAISAYDTGRSSFAGAGLYLLVCIPYTMIAIRGR